MSNSNPSSNRWRNSQAKPSLAVRLADLTLSGDFCDAYVTCEANSNDTSNEPQTRVPIVRAVLAAGSSFLEQRLSAALKDKGVGEICIRLPVTAGALRCALAFCCCAPPSEESGLRRNCIATADQLGDAEKALDLPGLQAWAKREMPTAQASEVPVIEQQPQTESLPALVEQEPAAPSVPSKGKKTKVNGSLAEPARRDVVIVGSIILILLSAIAWSPALSYNMIANGAFMDDAMIVKNRNVYEPIDWRRIMGTDYWGLEMFDGSWTHKSFRPLAVLTFRLNYWLHGFDSAGFHLTNLLLHTLSSVLLGLFGVVGLSLPTSWSTLLAGLFFLHPVHTENVLYIVGRADLLCCALVLLAALVYAPCLKGRGPGVVGSCVLILASTGLIVAAGLCKETGFCFFGLLAGWEILRILTASVGRAKRNWMRLVMMLIFGSVACYVRVWYTGGTSIDTMDPHSNPIAVEPDGLVRKLSYALVHGLYAKLMVWPTFLCYDYSFDAIPLVRTVGDLRLMCPLSAYLGFAQLLTCAMWPLRSRWRSMGAHVRKNGKARAVVSGSALEAPILGLAFLLLSFFPMSNVLFPVGTVIGERLLYLPSAGLLLALVGLGHLVEQRTVGLKRHIPVAFLLVAGICGAWLLALRVPDWKDAEAITVADGKKQLRSGRVQFNYANVHLQAQRYDEALETYNRAIAMDPQDHDSLPLYHAGQILIFKGQHKEAETYLARAVAGYFSPLTIKEEEIWHDYALSLWFVQNAEGAVQNFQKSLTINPTFTKAWNNLGCAAGLGALLGLLPRAAMQDGLQALERAIEFEPESPLYWRNAVALLQLNGDTQAATGAWNRLLAIDPSAAAVGPPQDCSWEFYFR